MEETISLSWNEGTVNIMGIDISITSDEMNQFGSEPGKVLQV